MKKLLFVPLPFQPDPCLDEFPLDGGGQGLAHLHQAAGEAPGIPGRLLAPEHQQHFLALKNHGAHPH